MNAVDAKRNSEIWIAAAGVAVNPDLPQIEEPTELTPRSPRDVAIRAWVMAHLVYLGYGNTGTQILGLLSEARLDVFLSAQERALCECSRLDEQQKAWAAWHCEAVHGCVWALGMVDTHALDDCPDTLASMFPVAKDPWPSIEKAALRDFDQLYARADTMYRLHWAAVEARLNGQPFKLPEAAIVMRRRSVEWIAGSPYDWDDVPLDT